jgi:hypothetical protein
MKNILLTIGAIYFFSFAGFSLYYSHLYYKEHGFWAWLFFGEFKCILKALVWPLFQFNII